MNAFPDAAVSASRSVADLVANAAHSGPLDGAAGRGEAVADGRVVQVAVWLAGGRVSRARFRASACAALIAYAEAACALLEAGVAAAALDASLRRAVGGVHPTHLDRAALVVAAARAALTSGLEPT